MGSCGEGFWRRPRRRGRSIPVAGCDGRANAGRRQKIRRPKGFRGKGHLASLLLGHRPLAGMLPRRAMRPFPRKQDPTEFSSRLLGFCGTVSWHTARIPRLGPVPSDRSFQRRIFGPATEDAAATGRDDSRPENFARRVGLALIRRATAKPVGTARCAVRAARSVATWGVIRTSRVIRSAR